jgi:hypothetical protein
MLIEKAMDLEGKNVELVLVLFQGTFLLQLGESFHGVIIGTPAKPDLDSQNEIRPRRDFIASLELLEHQSFAIHMEDGNGETLGVRCEIHLKELLSPATPSFKIISIELRKLQSNGLGFKTLPGMGIVLKGMGLTAKADGGWVRRVWLQILERMSVWRVGFNVGLSVGFRGMDRLFFGIFGTVIHKELHHLC